MSMILFFGLATVVTIVGVIFTAMVIHHHWFKKSGKRAPGSTET